MLDYSVIDKKYYDEEKYDLVVRDDSVRVRIRYHDNPIPEKKIDLFLVVNDGGYPFLFGCCLTSYGVEVRDQCHYITKEVETNLRKMKGVDVVEANNVERREYRVRLLHCFE